MQRKVDRQAVTGATCSPMAEAAWNTFGLAGFRPKEGCSLCSASSTRLTGHSDLIDRAVPAQPHFGVRGSGPGGADKDAVRSRQLWWLICHARPICATNTLQHAGPHARQVECVAACPLVLHDAAGAVLQSGSQWNAAGHGRHVSNHTDVPSGRQMRVQKRYRTMSGGRRQKA